MDITSLLNNDGNTEAVRGALHNVKAALRNAAHDYAEAALGAANETLKGVQAADPCCAVWPHMLEYQEFMQKAHDALNAATQATGMLLMAEETGDEHVDNMNREAKVSSLEIHVVSSLIEGANTRMNVALQGIPSNGAPGQRCNPEALATPPPEG